MRRACPTCGADVLEDDRRVRCPEHGELRAWVVLNEEGLIVAAGTMRAAWLSPERPFTAFPGLRVVT